MTIDPYFDKLGNFHPFASIGFQGEAGSGKSHSAALIAKGLYEQIKSTKPITIFSTEPTTNFVGPILEGIDVQIKESLTLPDLAMTIDKCAGGASDILIIDSLTGVWTQFLSAWSNEGRLELTQQDYVRINTIWENKIFLPLKSANVHVLFTIREGNAYEKHISDGKTDYTKSGTKRLIGTNFGFEPDVLVKMKVDEFAIGQQRGRSHRRGIVLKGRGPDLIDGLAVIDPKYDDFRKYVDFILNNPATRQTTETKSNQELIREENAPTSADWEAVIAMERNRKLLESVEIDNAAENKITRLALTQSAYDETSPTAIQSMTAGQHREAFRFLEPMAEAIILVRQWEPLAYPDAVIPLAARLEHLKTDNLGAANCDALAKYHTILERKHNNPTAKKNRARSKRSGG